MGEVRIPYYVVKTIAGRRFGYWQPTRKMRHLGFSAVTCGVDGPDAWRKAAEWNDRWQRARRGLEPTTKGRVWPKGSLGEAFERCKRTELGAAKAPRTREEWLRAWARMEPDFGDVDPRTVDLETIDLFYADQLATTGVREAHRTIKIWRALWRVAAAMKYCDRDGDPSLAIRRKTPTPRSMVWREGEIVRLIKHAIRRGYTGLACIIAVAWDTQFAPADIRKLNPTHLIRLNGRLVFQVFEAGREKTGAPMLGTISQRTERLVLAYLDGLPAHPMATAPLFRNRSGRAYSKDTLGDDFRDIRAELMPGDARTIGHDMRRSGTIEAFTGGAETAAVSAKMANSISQSAELQRTYFPVSAAAVDQADQARRRGRKIIRENG